MKKRALIQTKMIVLKINIHIQLLDTIIKKKIKIDKHNINPHSKHSKDIRKGLVDDYTYSEQDNDDKVIMN